MQRFRARELSSAGSEHLPYKQGVTSSNLVVPTKDTRTTRVFFFIPSGRVDVRQAWLLWYKKSARNCLQALWFVEHTGVGPVTS